MFWHRLNLRFTGSTRAALSALALVAVVAATPRPALAADPSLLESVPGGAALAVHCKASAKDDFLEAYWADVFAAFQESGVLESAIDFVSAQAKAEDLQQFNSVMENVQELLFAVQWQDMISREVVYAMGWPYGDDELIVTAPDGEEVPRMWPSQYAMFRLANADSAKENATALAEILRALEGLAADDDIKIVASDSHGAHWEALSVGGVFDLGVAQRGSLVAVYWDDALLSESFALMAGESDNAPLAKSDRFTSIIERLPAADTQTSYVDVTAILDAVQRGFSTAYELNAAKDADDELVFEALNWFFDNFSGVDRAASTTRFEGHRQIVEELAIAAPGHADTVLGKILGEQRAFQDFHKFVPKDVKSFNVSSGFSPLRAYEGIADFVGRFPGGEEGLQGLEQMFEMIAGMKIREDLLGWIGGEAVSVVFPTAMMQPGEQAMLLGLRDTDKALDAIEKGVKQIDNLLAMQGMAPLKRKAAPGELGKQGFVLITHPQFEAMGASLVMGVDQDFLLVGTAKALEKVSQTMNGKAPTILDNQRFKDEGVLPQGPATSVSFADVSEEAANVAMALNMTGMLAMMIPPNDPDAEVGRQLLAMLQRLAPVAQKFDFFKTTASATTFDGTAWHKISATTYK
jgi:hypothetical protein